MLFPAAGADDKELRTNLRKTPPAPDQYHSRQKGITGQYMLKSYPFQAGSKFSVQLFIPSQKFFPDFLLTHPHFFRYTRHAQGLLYHPESALHKNGLFFLHVHVHF